MFRKEEQSFGEFNIFNNEKKCSIRFIPEYGANIRELILTSESKSLSVLDGVDSYKELLDDKAFKSSLLLPWPNRVKDGKYIFKDKKYDLPVNEKEKNNALHGFIFGQRFEVTDEDLQEDFARIKLENYYDGSYPGYPFKFKTQLDYHLSIKHGFTIRVTVENIDDQELPMGIGWHPYFKFESHVDDLELQVPALLKYELNDQSIPTGEKKTYSAFAGSNMIGVTELDDCFELINPKQIAETRIRDPKHSVELIFWQETGEKRFNYLQLFTPPGRKTIAVEPMTCAINSFNNNEGLIKMNPGEKLFGTFGVKMI